MARNPRTLVNLRHLDRLRAEDARRGIHFASGPPPEEVQWMSRSHKGKFRLGRSYVIFLLLGALGAASFSTPLSRAQDAAPASPGQTQTDSAWSLSTTRFDNSFEAEPVVGNGYIGLRVPAAGMGYLGDLGKVGWPIGTERIASAIAAGVYAKVADGTFYHDEKQAIALIPNWSTLTFGDASGIYSPATASSVMSASTGRSSTSAPASLAPPVFGPRRVGTRRASPIVWARTARAATLRW